MNPLSKLLNGVRLTLFKKALSSLVPAYVLQPEARIRTPPWDYEKIHEFARRNWLIRQIFRVIIQEVVRPRWVVIPKFVRKCVKCGAEFATEVEACEKCGGKTRPPDETQRRRLLRLLERPNPSYSFGDLIRAIVWDDLLFDDWYISIARMKVEINGRVFLIPYEIYVEDPRYLRIVADEHGRLGNDEYFCPLCYKEDEYVVRMPGDPVPTCPKCGAEMEQTCYVILIQGAIKARFGRNEIVHGSTGRVPPELYGSPKIVAVWQILHLLQSMDDYNWELYSEGKMGKIVTFKGYTQEQVDALIKKLEADMKALSNIDLTTGEQKRSLKIKTLFLGSKDDIKVYDILNDLAKMQSLEFYKFYREVVMGVWGVVPVMAAATQERAGQMSPVVQLEVQNRTTQEIMADKEEVFNTQLLPLFGITDWLWEFNEVELKDELKRAQIEQIKANTAATWRNAGFDVSLDEYGELVVSKPKELPPPFRTRPVGRTKAKPKISESTGGIIEGTTTERFPSGPRGAPE